MKAKTNTAIVKRDTVRKNTALVKTDRQPGLPSKKQLVYSIPQKDNNNAFLATLAIGAAGVIGYFGYEYYKKKKISHSAYSPSSSFLPSADNAYTGSSNADTTASGGKKSKKSSYSDDNGSSSASNEFPLKKGSKGEKVRRMQQALIDKFGSSILPKYGADGDFGTETSKGLKKAGYPATISQSTYNVITGGSGSADPQKIAEGLHTAGENGDFSAALQLLKQMDSKDDYHKVSTAYESYTEGFVSKTLVNGMLDAFSTDDQKQQIRMEFLRMGLQYDGSKWSLSGFDGVPLITKVATTVWVNADETIQVPAKMVLGNEVGKRLDFTLFEHKGKYFLVKTSAVKHFK